MNVTCLFTVLLYGGLSFGGGVMGYMQSGSSASLFMGTLVAIMLMIGIKIADDDKNTAYIYLSAISLIMAGFFLSRFVASSFAIMPGGLMLLASVMTAAVVGTSINNNDESETAS